MSIQRGYEFRYIKGYGYDGIIRYECCKDSKGFFSKPKLSIEYDERKYPSIYVPERTYANERREIHRKFLRIHVRNKGPEIAKHCKARLIVIRTVQQQYPAIQEVPLTWEGGDVNVNTDTQKEIQPNSNELLHIIFSDSTFSTVKVDPPNSIHAVSSRKEYLDNTSTQFIENAFTVGEFRIKVIITSDNAKACKSYFDVHVGKEWNQLRMKEISWFKYAFWRHS